MILCLYFILSSRTVGTTRPFNLARLGIGPFVSLENLDRGRGKTASSLFITKKGILWPGLNSSRIWFGGEKNKERRLRIWDSIVIKERGCVELPLFNIFAKMLLFLKTYLKKTRMNSFIEMNLEYLQCDIETTSILVKRPRLNLRMHFFILRRQN